ncbi:MAG: TPM domain-containing protein [Cyanobacteria bacterium P01_A01_bin.137]
MEFSHVRLRAWSWLLVLCLACSLIGLVQAPGQTILIKEVPNPQNVDGTWVMDMAELITPDSEAKLNQMISDLEAATSAEIAIVTVYNTQPSITPKAFATELFNTWGIGKQGRNNGVLFLVSKDEHRTEIETGSGLDARLPNAKVKRILQRQVMPRFKTDNFDAGIMDRTKALIAAIEGHGWSIQDLSIKQVAIALLLIPVAFFSQRTLKHGAAVKIPLSPLQEHTLPPINRWHHWLFLGTRWLAGNQIFTPHLPTLRELEGRYLKSQVAINQSWLRMHHCPHQLMNQGLRLLPVGLILGIAITSMLPRNSVTLFFMMPLCPLVWLGYEMWECTRWGKKRLSQSEADQAKREILGKIGCLCCAVTFVFLLLGIVNPWVAIGAVSGIIFTCAGLVRYIRLHPLDSQTVICLDCGNTMEKLSSPQLIHRLTKPQKTEVGLKSVVYEGWHCPNHGHKKREHGLDSHLIAYLVTDNAIGYCPTCKGLTVELTTKVKQPATSALPGCQVITRQCHCCDRTTQTEELIPKRSAPRRLSYSSHTHNLDHTESYYQSSGSGSSGSSSGNTSDGGFGGGSSDGGGAGDSW